MKCVSLLQSYTRKLVIHLGSCCPMAMAFQIIASSCSSSPTITQSHLLSFPPLQPSCKASSFKLSSWASLLGSSSRFSPYIGLKHMGISISPKSSNPGVEFLYLLTKLVPFCCKNLFIFFVCNWVSFVVQRRREDVVRV